MDSQAVAGQVALVQNVSGPVCGGRAELIQKGSGVNNVTRGNAYENNAAVGAPYWFSFSAYQAQPRSSPMCTLPGPGFQAGLGRCSALVQTCTWW